MCFRSSEIVFQSRGHWGALMQHPHAHSHLCTFAVLLGQPEERICPCSCRHILERPVLGAHQSVTCRESGEPSMQVASQMTSHMSLNCNSEMSVLSEASTRQANHGTSAPAPAWVTSCPGSPSLRQEEEWRHLAVTTVCPLSRLHGLRRHQESVCAPGRDEK